jgi:HEAT repeat protein
MRLNLKSVALLLPSLLLLLPELGVCQVLAQPESSKATEALAVLRDPARTQEEWSDAAQTLLLLGPEIKPIEPVLLQVLQQKEPESGPGGDPDTMLWMIAARSLAHLVPDPASVPVLIKFLQRHENYLVRAGAVLALANLGAEARPAVPALVELLSDDPDYDMPELAAFALAHIAPDPSVEAAVPWLLATAQDRYLFTRFHAAVALLKLGREEEMARAIVRDELNISSLLPLLENENPSKRIHVCEALEHFGPPQRDYLDLLRKRVAEDPDARVRGAALKALRKVAADERAAIPTDPAPQILPTLAPELADAARAVLEWQRTLGSDDPDRLIGLRLLGGTLTECSTAEIDFFRWSGTRYGQGRVTMIPEGGRWVYASYSDYGASEPFIDESTPIGRNEAAAIRMLKAIAAAQIDHWNWSSPPSYADSLERLVGHREVSQDGYVITLTAGARSNGIYHAWSAEAHPLRYGKTGIRSFYLDERGVLLDSDTRGLPLALNMPEH